MYKIAYAVTEDKDLTDIGKDQRQITFRHDYRKPFKECTYIQWYSRDREGNELVSWRHMRTFTKQNDLYLRAKFHHLHVQVSTC